MIFFAKVLLAAFIIAFAIASIIAIAFSYLEYKNTENSVIFAKSILIGVPVSYLFFIPFFFAKSLNMNFWIIYGIGLLLLIIGYFLHKYIINLI